MADFVGLNEIAEMLDVSRMTASRYARRDDFPTPAQELSRGRLWRRREVAAWAKRTLPLARTGRPPKA